MMICSQCGNAHARTGQRQCAPCHAAYQRGWRHRETASKKYADVHNIVCRETFLFDEELARLDVAVAALSDDLAGSL